MTATADRCRGVLLVAYLAAIPLLPAPIFGAQGPATGAYFIPGDPKAGMQVFFDKGCARCHSVLGEGGHTAPDLARAPAGHLSAAELVAAMWNHAPAMWQKIQLEMLSPPKFTDDEMTNLFAFLYSVRSLDEPGDPERGRQLLSEKQCLTCHAVKGEGGRIGPDLNSWAGYRNPVSWIQSMWNHGPAMQTQMARRGLTWPVFQGSDMTDMIAYVRTLATGSRGRVHLVRQANSDAGRRLFRTKGCGGCHAVRGSGGARGPDLAAGQFPRTLGRFAALMWNHAPMMWTNMQAQRVGPPEFSNQEMADLIAYLFTERFFETAGNAGRGRRLFEEKGCGGCHTINRGAGRGPDLAAWRGRASPVPVAASLWNHGPLMLEQMGAQNVAWPRFRAGEMADLLEFLNRAGTSEASSKGAP